jgi:hypothetical protein
MSFENPKEPPKKNLEIPVEIGSQKRTEQEIKDFKKLREETEKNLKEKKEKPEMPTESSEAKTEESLIVIPPEIGTEKRSQEEVEDLRRIRQEIEKKEKEKNLEKLENQLNESREEYLKKEIELKNLKKKQRGLLKGIFKKKETPEIKRKELELEELKSKYENARAEYANELYKLKIEEINKLEISEDDKKREIERVKGFLFKSLIIDEVEKCNKALSESDKRTKSSFSKLLKFWAQRPLWQRVALISLLSTTGLAVGATVGLTSASISLATAAVFAGNRFVRGIVFGAAFGGVFKFISGTLHQIFSPKIERTYQEEIGKLNARFNLDIERSIDKGEEMKKFFNELIQGYEDAIKERTKKYKNIQLAAAGITIGLAGSLALGSLLSGGAEASVQKSSFVPEGGSKGSVPDTLGGKSGIGTSIEEKKFEIGVGSPHPTEQTWQEIYQYTVEKGGSPLRYAKKFFIENAQKFGYDSAKTGLKVDKWAEIFSARHLVGQYILEHKSEFKDLISKIGEPPTDPVKLDEWLHKVPKSVFNDILHNKVPNLVYEGDTVEINAKVGHIHTYGPDHTLRTGHIEVKPAKISPTELQKPKVHHKILPTEIKKTEVPTKPSFVEVAQGTSSKGVIKEIPPKIEKVPIKPVEPMPPSEFYRIISEETISKSLNNLYDVDPKIFVKIKYLTVKEFLDLPRQTSQIEYFPETYIPETFYRPWEYYTPFEGYDFTKISKLHQAIKKIYESLPATEKAFANHSTLVDFIKKYYPKLLVPSK